MYTKENKTSVRHAIACGAEQTITLSCSLESINLDFQEVGKKTCLILKFLAFLHAACHLGYSPLSKTYPLFNFGGTWGVGGKCDEQRSALCCAGRDLV